MYFGCMVVGWLNVSQSWFCQLFCWPMNLALSLGLFVAFQCCMLKSGRNGPGDKATMNPFSQQFAYIKKLRLLGNGQQITLYWLSLSMVLLYSHRYMQSRVLPAYW